MRKGRPSDKEKNLIYAASKFNKLATETALKLQMNKSALVRKKLDKPVDEMAVRDERFDRYFDNVSDYAYDFFGVNFWQKQLEIANALKHKNFVCVRSAHSTGKSYLLGILINFYFDTVYPLIGILNC